MELAIFQKQWEIEDTLETLESMLANGSNPVSMRAFLSMAIDLYGMEDFFKGAELSHKKSLIQYILTA